MHLSTALAAVALLATAGEAATAVPLTRQPRYIFADGRANIEAYTWELRTMAAKYERNARNIRATRSGNTTLAERGLLNLAYPESYVWTGPVQVGTPAQTYVTYFDTGSADFTMADVSCSAAKCGTKKRYDVSTSSTGVKTTTTSRTNFADGTSSVGTLMRDNVVVGGTPAPNQAIISSTSLSSTVADLPSDALMGLAWSGLASGAQKSVPVNQADNAGSVSGAGVFGMSLSKTPGQSHIIFGGYARNGISGKIRFYNIINDAGNAFPTYWQIGGSAPYVNGEQAVAGYQNFILDSGTTLIIAPAGAAAEFWAKIPGSAKYDNNMWTFPCNTAPLVEMRFTRIPNLWSVASKDFNLGYVDAAKSRCLGAVATLNVGLGSSWILGDSFLLSWYIIHDVRNRRIGIVAKK